MQDTYRPARPDRDRDRGRERPPPLADRMTFSNGGSGDNYRPAQSDFTFESSRPAPRFPPSGPAADGSRAPPRNSRGRRGRGDHHGRHNANGSRRGAPYKKQAPHERALLRHRDAGSPELSYGIEGPSRFMNLDDMSDDQEADMDESDVSAGGAEGQPEPKAARVRASRADGNSEPKWAPIPTPKWSNPDPYTALPPPSETTGVKKDVVQLIRKAKNQDAEKAISNNAVAANDDFISFNDEDDDVDDEVDDAPGLLIYEDEEPIRGRDRGRGNDRNRVDQGSMNDVAYIDDMLSTRPLPPSPPRDTYQPQAGGGRNKRRFGDEVSIVYEWLPTPKGSHPTPWAERTGTYDRLNREPEKWLHNEILDFYDWVAPQDYEHEARHQLVQRLRSALGSQRWFPQDTGTILPFGSYPAGLYLPTADMDLVYASERHYAGGPPVLDVVKDKQLIKSTLFKASRRIHSVGIPTNKPLVIHSAKVPIIKFKDRLTGLDVDISFENLSGVQAQATFKEWKDRHPDLVYMVALVKQLLVMRGLNEVHSGGLGGFTIICLIVSYLEHTGKPENLGQCLLGFLKYYGKQFDLSRKRIQMKPPAIVEKSMYGIDNRLEQPTGLSIQDPNRPENNISGGSHKAVNAFKLFANAYETLMDRFEAVELGNFKGTSLLECMIGGNYTSYITQRRHMRSLK
ncbi:hypothetical protein CC86DRAFT_392988 [Ophiobolus disseminans]|uniref:polynucleotide adenylyltransferase n=1 Tax=Ophiobolus disseminans TaxID=1469910 RepID=A0A6A7A6C4_9PLEO|nr:hypothetical protein CC86DRAFT_392988 [Ophiobolus disseminans]